MQRYQSYLNQPIQFMNNQMLNNNPIYATNIHDQNFYQQMMLQREDQMRKIRNISDLNMSREQITEYVIAPIKIERGDKGEIERYTTEEESMMTKKFIEDNWWSKRTNEPYKNILKDEDWRKDFKKEDDLIVHKVTDLDKIGLMDDYKTLVDLIEVHDGELKVIFSSSKETEHKKAFKFVQKYKYRMKYDPKDYNDLKDYYKKEQKKFDREQKHIDNVISRLMDDEIDAKELKCIESEFLKPSKSKKKSKNKGRDHDANIDREIQEFIDEYGEEALETLLEDSDEDTSSKKKAEKNHVSKEDKKRHNKVKVRVVDKDKSEESDEKQSRSRIRIKKRTVEATQKDRSKDLSDKDLSVKAEKPSRIRIKRIADESKSEPVNEKIDSDKKIRIRIKPKDKSKSKTNTSEESDVDKRKKKIIVKSSNESTGDSSIKRIRITRKPIQ